MDVLGPAGEILWLGQAGAALGLVLFLQPWLKELLAFGVAQRQLVTAGGGMMGWGRRDPWAGTYAAAEVYWDPSGPPDPCSIP